MRFLQKTLIASATVGAVTIGISFAQDVTSSQEVIPSDENIVPSEQAPQKIERMASESELDFLSRNAAEEFPQLTISEERKPVSVTIRALNKITARYVDIEANMEEVAKFGTLEVVPRYCDKRPPEEFPETTAFLQVYDLGNKNDADDEAASTAADTEEVLSGDDLPVAQSDIADVLPANDGLPVDALGDLSDGNKIFSGWMFASSPALNPLEHAVYDLWVIDCKTVVADNLSDAL